MAETNAYLFAGKVRLGLRFFPGNMSRLPDDLQDLAGGRIPLHGGKPFGLTLGIADFNGMVYWLTRLF
jgi:hypothetical protein